jgi:Rieske Fe-S protein
MKKQTEIVNEAEKDCAGCPLVSDRREFLRSAGALALAAISLALPIRTTSASVLTSVSEKGSLSYPIPSADGAEIDGGNEVILVRYHNEVFAFNLSCPHQNTALRWNESVERFQCPKHHSQYQPDGEFITGRATRNMDRLSIKRAGANSVIVDPNTMYQSDDDAPEWAAAVIKL